MMPKISLAVIALTLSVGPRWGHSEPAADAQAHATPSRYSAGFRFGGYGFRQQEPGGTNWDDCRMGGLGVFGERTLGRHFYAEAGADVYYAEGAETGPVDEMDRLSGIATLAAGVRLFPDKWVSGHVQAGTGLELTSIEIRGQEQTHSAQRALPLGFVGFGVEVKIMKKLRLGGNVRTYVMGHFEHDHAAASEPVMPPVAGLEHDHEAHDLNAEPEIAAQGQLYLRYQL